jgi:hypothetical protein
MPISGGRDRLPRDIALCYIGIIARRIGAIVPILTGIGLLAVAVVTEIAGVGPVPPVERVVIVRKSEPGAGPSPPEIGIGRGKG